MFLNYPNKVRTITHDEIPEGNWEDSIIVVNIPRSFDVKNFDVKSLMIDDKIYLKPKKPYYNNEFERLFNFDFMCKDYDNSRVILVIEPSNL